MTMRRLIATFLAVLMLVGCVAPYADNTMMPGTYYASASGMDGEVQIAVTVTGDRIESIEIIDDNETAGVGDRALQIVSDAVLENQSLAVDSVSGATISSAALKMAIADALGQAGADVSEWRNREISREVLDEAFTYDVVVVGAGFAGIQTAATASRNGAKVALIEKLGIVGGTSIFSSGAFVAAFTDEEVPEKLQIWLDRNTQFDNQINLEKLETAMENSPEIISNFTSMNVNGKPFMETGWGVEASEKVTIQSWNRKLTKQENTKSLQKIYTHSANL